MLLTLLVWFVEFCKDYLHRTLQPGTHDHACHAPFDPTPTPARINYFVGSFPFTSSLELTLLWAFDLLALALGCLQLQVR